MGLLLLDFTENSFFLYPICTEIDFLQDVMKNNLARLHIGIPIGNIFICLFTEVHHCILHNSFIGHGKKIVYVAILFRHFAVYGDIKKYMFSPIVHKIVALSLSVYISLK